MSLALPKKIYLGVYGGRRPKPACDQGCSLVSNPWGFIINARTKQAWEFHQNLSEVHLKPGERGWGREIHTSHIGLPTLTDLL